MAVLETTDALIHCAPTFIPAHQPPPCPQVEKARSWFNRAVTLNPDVGDHWAHFYKFECQFGTPEQQVGWRDGGVGGCEGRSKGVAWCRYCKT